MAYSRDPEDHGCRSAHYACQSRFHRSPFFHRKSTTPAMYRGPLASSKRHPPRDLKQSWIVQICRDVAELRIAKNAIRAAKLDPVEQVECFDPQLQRDVLMDRCVFEQSKIIIGNPGRTQRIVRSGFVTVSEDRRSRVASCIEVIAC